MKKDNVSIICSNLGALSIKKEIKYAIDEPYKEKSLDDTRLKTTLEYLDEYLSEIKSVRKEDRFHKISQEKIINNMLVNFINSWIDFSKIKINLVFYNLNEKNKIYNVIHDHTIHFKPIRILK